MFQSFHCRFKMSELELEENVQKNHEVMNEVILMRMEFLRTISENDL